MNRYERRWQDDPAAVVLLWDRYAHDLLAFLQALLCSRHDAEDVLQTVFIRIVRKRQYLANARSLDGYIFQSRETKRPAFSRGLPAPMQRRPVARSR